MFLQLLKRLLCHRTWVFEMKKLARKTSCCFTCPCANLPCACGSRNVVGLWMEPVAASRCRMLCPGRALPAGGGVGNINICTFPILLHHTRLCLTSVMLKSLPKTPLKSQMSTMSTGRWRSPLGCLIAEPNAPCPTLATVRVALVATVLALGLACGLSNTPVTCSAFLPATTMPLSQSRARQVPCSSKVCRNLFGPVDHHQLQNDSEKLLKQHLEEAQQRWNFNFETETPLEGQFKWERVFLAEQLPQEVHNLVKVTSSESRSSLVRKVSPKDCLGRICPEGSQQSLEVYRAGSPQSLKRGQTTIKDFYSSKRKIVPDKPKP